MPGLAGGRRVAIEFPGERGPVAVSAEVRDAPPLTGEEVREQLPVVRRVLGRQTGVKTREPALVSSILVGERRYDAWRSVEVREEGRALPKLAVVPLVTWILHVRSRGFEYTSLYAGPPFPVEGLERLAPARGADRMAVMDAGAYDGRELELRPYRRHAAFRPQEVAAQYELALMIWFQHFFGAPGPVLEAEPPLRRALERNPRAHACHGLLGEVLLRGGRDADAARSFAEAASLHPRPLRYLYCASVALENAGNAPAAERSKVAAQKLAGPRPKDRFTPGSNPLEDHRYALLREAMRLRKKREESTFVG